MPSIEDVLREKTHKGDGLEMYERVYYTLTDEPEFAQTRTMRLVSKLIEHLLQKKLLSESELDSILLEIAK